MSKRVTTFLAALVLFGAGAAAAQTTATATSSITIGQVLYIGLATGNPTFSSPTAADFNAGEITSSTSATVTHAGNVTHTVTIKADAANMTASVDPVNDIKPASDLQWDAGSGWGSVSTSGADVVTSAPKGVGTATVNYKMLLDYSTDAPDTYTLGITYTVVAG